MQLGLTQSCYKLALTYHTKLPWSKLPDYRAISFPFLNIINVQTLKIPYRDAIICSFSMLSFAKGAIGSNSEAIRLKIDAINLPGPHYVAKK